MTRAVAAACLTCLLGFALAGQPTAAGDGPRELRLTTYTPSSISDIFRGDWRTGEVEISGRLALPEGRGPFPAVVLYHGSSHPRLLDSWFRQLSPALRRNGIAAFVLDSYTGRDIVSSTSNQSRLSKAARVVDALRAFETLAGLPEIDGSRIGISGYSFGGIVALVSADRRIVKAVVGTDMGFAAHLPVYSSCQAQFRVSHFTDAAILILAGGRDDYTPATYCRDYAARLRSEGFNVTMKLYPEAHHGWVMGHDVTFCPGCFTAKDCGAIIIDDDGHEVALAGRASTRDGWDSYVATIARTCGKRGATVGANDEARRDTLLTTVTFFSENL